RPAGGRRGRRARGTVAKRRLRQLGEGERGDPSHPRPVIGLEMEERAELRVPRVVLEDHSDQTPPWLRARQDGVEGPYLALESADVRQGAPGREEARRRDQQQRERSPQAARGPQERRDEKREDQRVALVELPHPPDGHGEGKVEQRRPDETQRHQPAPPGMLLGVQLLRLGETYGG